VTLQELNACDRNGFVQAVGWVFEHSPWVAERTWARRPFATVDQLHEAMAAEVENASPPEQLALLSAHPDLGSSAKMTEVSASEQAGAGLDNVTRGELERLRALNAAYREKFGFPFVYAVKGSSKTGMRPKHDILNALETRLLSTREHEFAEALRQVYRIARFRLEEMF
jgi:2-oxo-4-hydroxy-4-carboxy-5-ureidoimidazoline decarboxylase